MECYANESPRFWSRSENSPSKPARKSWKLLHSFFCLLSVLFFVYLLVIALALLDIYEHCKPGDYQYDGQPNCLGPMQCLGDRPLLWRQLIGPIQYIRFFHSVRRPATNCGRSDSGGFYYGKYGSRLCARFVQLHIPCIVYLIWSHVCKQLSNLSIFHLNTNCSE